MRDQRLPASAWRRGLLVRVAGAGACVTLLWGPGLPNYLLLDPLALGPAVVFGGAAALVATLAGLCLTAWRTRRDPLAVHAGRVAVDFVLPACLSALAGWGALRLDDRVPYLEVFALLAVDLAALVGVGVPLYVLCRQLARRLAHTAAPAPALPGVRSVFAIVAGAPALVAAVLLVVGSLARVASDRDRALVAELGDQLHLAAAAIDRPGADVDAILDEVRRATGARVELRPRGAPPPVPSTLQVAGTDAWRVAVGEGERVHLMVASTNAGVLWLAASPDSSTAVRGVSAVAPDLLLLALLVLAAPLAAWLVGDDLARQLRDVTAALRALGDQETPERFAPLAHNQHQGHPRASLTVPVGLGEAARGWFWSVAQRRLGASPPSLRRRSSPRFVVVGPVGHGSSTQAMIFMGPPHLGQTRGWAAGPKTRRSRAAQGM